MTESFDLKRLADFLFEVGMLKKTPRTGYQFLGSGTENVAEHSFRAAVIGYVLARLTDADPAKVVFMCLFHDVHEARIGDFNYVNKLYNTCDPEKALHDALEGTGLSVELLLLHREMEGRENEEGVLAQDADQLDLILSLKQEQDLGNPYAAKWLDCALERLQSEAAKGLADAILETDHTSWWFDGPDRCWWVNPGKKK